MCNTPPPRAESHDVQYHGLRYYIDQKKSRARIFLVLEIQTLWHPMQMGSDSNPQDKLKADEWKSSRRMNESIMVPRSTQSTSRGEVGWIRCIQVLGGTPRRCSGHKRTGNARPTDAFRGVPCKYTSQRMMRNVRSIDAFRGTHSRCWVKAASIARKEIPRWRRSLCVL